MEPLNVRCERRRISVLCWGLFLLLIVTIAADFVLSFLVYRVLRVPAGIPNLSGWLGAVSQYLIGFPVCLLIFHRVPADPMEAFSLRAGHLVRFFLICCFVLMAGNFAGILVNEALANLLGHMPDNTLDELLSESSLFYNIAITVVAAPICEELVFRKGMLDRLNRLGDRPAMMVSALLFGLFHGNFYQFFYAWGIGVVFAYIYLRTAKVRYTIGLHMAVNFLFGVLPEVWYQMGGLTLAGIWEILLLILAAIGLVLIIRGRKRTRILQGWIDMGGRSWSTLALRTAGMIAVLILCGGMFIMNIFLL